MNGLSAVIFIPDDTGKTGYPQPTMLYPMLGTPLLTWLSRALFDSGIGRFFLVCHEQYLPSARACIPAQAEVKTSAASNPSDLLHVFLSTADEAEEEVTIVTGPTLYLPMLKKPEGSKEAAACCVQRQTLMEALDTEFSFSRFLHEQGAELRDREGFYSVDSPAGLPELTKLLRLDQLLRLRRLGVEILDPEQCYIDPGVRIEPGARLLPGTILRGNTVIRSGAVIGPWTQIEDSEIGERSVVNASRVSDSRVEADVMIGPFTHIQEGSVLGRAAQIDSFVGIKHTKLGEYSRVEQHSCLSNGEIGGGCEIGSGTSTASFDRVQEHKTVIGDRVFIGSHTALIPPVTIGAGAYIGAGSTITENIPEQALGIARSRQSNKKEWSLKHKQPL